MLFLAVASMLAGCDRLGPEAAPTTTPTASAPQSPAPITARGHGLRGQAVMGKDGYGIVRCGESSQHILEISPEAKPFLDKFLEGGAHEFFVEAEGEEAEAGHLRVTRFHRLYTEGPGCEGKLDPTAFVAWGNEPFWAASDAGGALRLERPGAEALVAKQSEAREEAGEWIVEGETGSGLLSLHLAPGYCSDGMSDALYAWTATARIGEQQFKGCGFPGFERR